MSTSGSLFTKNCEMKLRRNRWLEIHNLDEDDRRKLNSLINCNYFKSNLLVPLTCDGHWIQHGKNIPIPYPGSLPSDGEKFKGKVRMNVVKRNGKLDVYVDFLFIVVEEAEEEKNEEPRYDLFGEFAGYMQLKRY